MKAHELYQKHGLGARDDAMGMQYLILAGRLITSARAWCVKTEKPKPALSGAGLRLMPNAKLPVALRIRPTYFLIH